MNLVSLIVSALLALGAAANAGSIPKPSGGAFAEVVAGANPAPSPTPTPPPAPYDVVGGGGGPT